MKIMRKIIEIDEELCDGCGNCVPGCAEGALKIIDGKARVTEDKFCDGLGACIGECPNGALRIIEREAEDFDEEAVEQYLSAKENNKEAGGGCPSAALKVFSPSSSCAQANAPASLNGSSSALSQWPVQIRLIPPQAPFLKNADLLVMADCCGVAYPSLHKDFFKGKVVMVGCPKFDDAEDYIDRFAQIFQIASIKSITCLAMEVPCCSALPVIVKKGMEKAGKDIPMKQVVISQRGKII